jgi:hypothetical protein
MDTVTDLTFHSTLLKGYLNYDTPQWQIIDFRCITQAHPLFLGTAEIQHRLTGPNLPRHVTMHTSPLLWMSMERNMRRKRNIRVHASVSQESIRIDTYRSLELHTAYECPS